MDRSNEDMEEYKDEEYDIKEIQRAILDVYKVYRELCKKHNLRYYAIGGTCIGAVRHNGFIPWDDDMDVVMPYEDYKRFIQIAEKELQKPYEIIGPMNCKHYTENYIKIHNTNTTFIEEHTKEYPDRYSGIYIDIFPMYGLPENEKKRYKLQLMRENLQRCNLLKRFPYKFGINYKWKVAWCLFTPVRHVVPYYYFSVKEENVFKGYSFNESDKILFPWRRRPGKGYTYKNIFYYEDFKESIKVPFEDTVMKIPVGYDRYLKMDFGDYMKLPPAEEQIPRHPKARIDLKKPFRDCI